MSEAGKNLYKVKVTCTMYVVAKDKVDAEHVAGVWLSEETIVKFRAEPVVDETDPDVLDSVPWGEDGDFRTVAEWLKEMAT